MATLMLPKKQVIENIDQIEMKWTNFDILVKHMPENYQKNS